MSIFKFARKPDKAGPPNPASLPRRGIEREVAPERILQRLDWHVIRRLDGLLQGDYRSLFYGYGVDFADLREYQPEDDIRYIDWNVTARMDTPYVRQYVEDREITAWFLIDVSPSMDFGLQVDKRSTAIDFTAVLARLLTRHGNRIGALLYTGQGRARVIPARGGRDQVLRLINEMQRQPRLPGAPFTDLKGMLEGGLRSIKKRSLVFVISDFISAPGWERPLALLKQHHETLAVRIWDRREAELPDAGPLWIEDAETGEQILVDTHDAAFRRRFAAAVRRREAVLQDAFRHAGVQAWSLATDDDLARAILRFAALRKQRKHGGLRRSTWTEALQ